MKICFAVLRNRGRESKPTKAFLQVYIILWSFLAILHRGEELRKKHFRDKPKSVFPQSRKQDLRENPHQSVILNIVLLCNNERILKSLGVVPKYSNTFTCIINPRYSSMTKWTQILESNCARTSLNQQLIPTEQTKISTMKFFTLWNWNRNAVLIFSCSKRQGFVFFLI